MGRDSHTRDLAGRASPKDEGKQMVGFAVCFEIDAPATGYGHYSLCTWSGWERDRVITTHWLLTISILNQRDEWSSTVIGEDSFEKVLDTPEENHFESTRDVLAGLLATARGVS